MRYRLRCCRLCRPFRRPRTGNFFRCRCPIRQRRRLPISRHSIRCPDSIRCRALERLASSPCPKELAQGRRKLLRRKEQRGLMQCKGAWSCALLTADRERVNQRKRSSWGPPLLVGMPDLADMISGDAERFEKKAKNHG